VELTNQLFDLSKSESIPPADVPADIKQKFQQKLEEEIKHASAILQSKNVDIETINEYNKLKEELSKHRLSTEDATRLISILQCSRQI
jgi:hypothetical protein